MKVMGRRTLLFLLFGLPCLRAGGAGDSMEGELTKTAEGKPVLKTKDGRHIQLEGDHDTAGVVNDDRLKGSDLEVIGKLLSAHRFQIGPIHKKSMWVHRNGKRYMITYWCDLCSIRNYTPGKCQCCQEETELSLQEER